MDQTRAHYEAFVITSAKSMIITVTAKRIIHNILREDFWCFSP